MRRCYTGRNTQHTIVLPWLELLLLGRKVWFICLDIIHLSKIIIPPHRSTYVCTYILGAYDGMCRGVVTIWSPMDGGADRHRIQRIRWLQRRQLQLGHDVRRRIRAEPKGSVWNPIWLMANGVSRKINLFRSGAAPPPVHHPLKLGKLASNFHSDTRRMWANQRVFCVGGQTGFFYSGSATVFFGDSLTRWPPFSSLPALALLAFPLAALCLWLCLCLCRFSSFSCSRRSGIGAKSGENVMRWGPSRRDFPRRWSGGSAGCVGVTFVAVFSGVVNHKTRRRNSGPWILGGWRDDISLRGGCFHARRTKL